jgi:hypothetical protein
MKKKLKVWFVDDLEENLNTFKNAHGSTWDVKLFNNIEDVLENLKTEKPDALLVDLFFYETHQKSKEIEEKIKTKAKELQKEAHSIGANESRYLKGKELIKDVVKRYGGKFLVYAYTSKGPYILTNPVLDELAELDVSIVFKGRYSIATEKIVIERDIRRIREENSVTSKFKKYIISIIISMGIVSWIVGKVLDWLWKLLLK